MTALLRQYGPTAAIVYACLSTATFWTTFTALWNGVDMVKVLKEAREYVGLQSDSADQALEDESNAVQATSSQGRFWTTFGIAFAINKLYVPLKIPLTIFITRYLKRIK
jgi:hypothetical protein